MSDERRRALFKSLLDKQTREIESQTASGDSLASAYSAAAQEYRAIAASIGLFRSGIDLSQVTARDYMVEIVWDNE